MSKPIKVNLSRASVGLVKPDGKEFKPRKSVTVKRCFLELHVRPAKETNGWIRVPMLFDSGSDLSLLPHPKSRNNGELVPPSWLKTDAQVEINNSTSSYVSSAIEVRFVFPSLSNLEFESTFAFFPNPDSLTKKSQEKKFAATTRRRAQGDTRPLVYGLLGLTDVVKFFDISTIDDGDTLSFTHRNGGSRPKHPPT